jgi:hypothetical protein
MANSKISALPSATTPLAGTEVLPVVQGGITEQVSVANLTAGRAVSAASLSLTTTPLAASSGGTGLSALGTNVATWLGTPSSANLAAAVTDETGSGALVFGTAPTISDLTVSGTSGNVYSSTWTPSITNGTNTASSTAVECLFSRVANQITFAGAVTITPTLPATETRFTLSLPVASNFTLARDAAGTFWSITSATQNQGGSILGDTATDTLAFRMTPASTTASTYHFSGSYRVK